MRAELAQLGRNRKARAPPIPAETRGLAGSRGRGQPVSVGRLAIARNMNGHRNVHVPEILGKGSGTTS
ncbi:MAG: hypothetical protein NTZ37_06235 [Methanoregula sp.]|nr:hypothetical protein [Methanoregula sp.]